MSNFTETVRKFMQENQVEQIEISRKTDISPSHVSHILNENQKTVEPHSVPKFAKVVCCDKFQQAELLRAYLLDHIPEHFPPASLIDIVVKRGKGTDNHAIPHHAIKLAPDIEAALATLAARIPNDPNMRDLILRLAKFA